MKKKILILPILIILLTMSFCKKVEKKSTNFKDEKPNRIEFVENAVLDGRIYQIIKIDEIEYISNYHGGIYPLVKNN